MKVLLLMKAIDEGKKISFYYYNYNTSIWANRRSNTFIGGIPLKPHHHIDMRGTCINPQMIVKPVKLTKKYITIDNSKTKVLLPDWFRKPLGINKHNNHGMKVLCGRKKLWLDHIKGMVIL